MDILGYTRVSMAGLLAGALVGCTGGLSLGWALALGYHRHGPSDPADAPAYVMLGLMLAGACLGAITGLVIGVILCVRRSRRKALNQPS